MDVSQKILSDVTIFLKYSKYLPEKQRRETWEELVDRNKQMHIRKFPQLESEINDAYKFVLEKKVLPSMRSMQFAGKPIEVNGTRMFNCAYMPVDNWHAFQETMFLLLGGTGVGFSVQKHHIDKLPEIKKPNPNKTKRFLIGDSIEGWADAIKALMSSYFKGRDTIRFDFSDIRSKGARLVTTGGKAPGPEPLKICIVKMEAILSQKKDGEKLTSLEVFDLICHIADAVLAGGIRRAALICLFSADDEEMISAKTGSWWELNPQRGRSNNSAALLRYKVTKKFFNQLWDKIRLSGSGEPGIYLTNDKDWGTNPCCFTGETKILTHEGYKQIKDCIGENLLINKDGEVVNGTIWSNGEKDIVELTLSNKTKIRCTGDHRFMITSGEEKSAIELNKFRLMPFYSINNEVSEFTKYGFIQGDGVLGRLDSKSHKGLEINIGEKDFDIFELLNIESEVGKRTYYVNGYNEVLRSLKFDPSPLPERRFPKTYVFWDKGDKLMFLKGMYSANGSIIKGQRISYKTTSFQLGAELIDTLSSFGISAYMTTNKEKNVQFSNGTYTCKESYDINISRFDSVIKFAELIGFVHTYKQESLNSLILDKAPKVLKVKELSEKQEVFDFSLDDNTHWGIIEGVIAHNCEIALRPYQFCNLVEINASTIESQEDLNNRAAAASFIGTLQASYTDFHYLRSEWKRATDKDALLGVSMTGIASMEVFKYNIEQAVEVVRKENERVASIIGINSSARLTCVKPAGTTSLTLGTSSGIHAWHDQYYIRRIRIGKNESLYTYLSVYHPELVKDESFRPHDTAVIEVPQKSPNGAVTRNESALDLLNRVKVISERWVKNGHNNGNNTHNVSATITVKDNEWNEVGDWMWSNRDCYNGLAVLPHSEHTYVQAPFETIDKERYDELVSHLHSIDLTKVIEIEDLTDQKAEAACAGGVCEIV